MSYDTDCLQRQIIEMSQQLEGFEQWRKTAGGIRVPASTEDWNRYAEVSKQVEQLREQVDKVMGHIEAIWEQLEPPDTLRQIKLVVNN